MRQLLQNLLGNALKYRRRTAAGRPAQRHDLARRSAARSPWRTTASGSTQKYAEKIFKMFERLHRPDAVSKARALASRFAGKSPSGTAARSPRRAPPDRVRRSRSPCRSPGSNRIHAIMMQDKHKIPITILICDDDEDDRMLTQQALEDAHISNDLRFVEDGEQLLDYLYQRGNTRARPECAAPGTDPARPQHAEDGWARGPEG